MGAPYGNCNAAKNKSACISKAKKAYKSLTRMEALEIRANRKAGGTNWTNYKVGIRTSKPKLPKYISKKKRIVNYLKYI